jgi:Na+(H+)/acetate symporter ActP
MVAGAATATAGIFAGLLTDAPASTTGDALLAQPAAVSVPLAFLTMWVVSVRDPRRPRDVAAHMLALHGPEQLGLAVPRAAA